MKIITNEKAYVQLKDISYLLKNLNRQTTPPSIIDKCVSNIKKCSSYQDQCFLEFDDPLEIEFFKNLDYSIDYLEWKNLSEEEIIEIAAKIAEKKYEVVNKINLIKAEDHQQYISLAREYELLNFKINSLRDIIRIKKGESNIILPDEVKHQIKKDEKGIQNWLKRLIRKTNYNN